MRRYKCRAVLAAALLTAGCASAPEDRVDDGQPAVTATVGVKAGGTASAEPVVSSTAASGATASAAATAGDAKTSPDLVIDLNKQPPTADSEVICRQMLKPGSNVIINVCGTRPEWKKYERAEAHMAQDLLLRMQSGSFR